ncbi:MAG: RNA polymerase factor sigma-54, partial [Comamonadaceae bacterium]
PFLELNQDEAPREEFGLAQEDAPPPREEREAEAGEYLLGPGDDMRTVAAEPEAAGSEIEAPNWEGDGSTEVVPDDGEWGGEAPARKNNLSGDEELDATELARGQESLQAHLHRQALGLRLSEEDSCALRFLIESLNDDGYLDESIESLAAGLAPQDLEQQEELVQRFTMALRLLHHLEPVGVGARSLAECLTLQLKAMHAGDDAPDACATAIRICAQPMELLARRDIKRLMQLTGDSDAQVRAAIGLITRLEPKPGRRFIDVERNIVVPDVLVTPITRGPQARFRVQLNPDVMPRLRVHDIYAGALRSHKGEGYQALQQRLQEARWFIKNIQQRFDTILRVSNAIVERQRNFFVHGELAMRPLVLREIADELGL